ncbi:DNA-binding response regulator [Lysinibacillus alkalisoli]|uniref:DNA-binding response regulator n=1 Tax=Lysinibacillus alkalisoli TaxID=1911548 RepID=A0A917FX92_9BACI|nr:response regulator transcription factor [Lysinibacillus alkalisoli]GGG10154.1 DNA-binding response regulator [Lysinibacillus alkalisoli]
MSNHIVVIEDDTAIANLIKTTLALYHYKFTIAKNGTDGLKAVVSQQPDVIILDLGLPDMDGIDIITSVRSWTSTPIIVVSARTEPEDKIMALDLGADDYVTKPFSVDELLARIRVALRKHPTIDEPVFHNGDLTIDYQAKIVTVADKEVHLTPIEYQLLTILAKNMGKVLTHNYLLKEVWDTTLQADVASLRVFMATLRKKIEQHSAVPMYIQTHVRIGYRMLHVDH